MKIHTKYYPWVIIVLSFIFFIPFIGSTHLFDWDEINFAESAREMIVTGDYMRVRINYDPFWEKPPLFFWMQVLCMKLFGVNEFAARMPNAIIGCITLLTIYFIGKKLKDEKYGLLWVALYAGSMLPFLYFKSGIIDPTFNLFIFVSIWFLYRNLNENESKLKMALYSGLFAGLAVLTKGPVAILLILLSFISFIIYNRFKIKIRILDVLVFIISALLVSSIWFGYEVYQNGFWFIGKFIEYQIGLFSKNAVAAHVQPFHYHFIVVLIGCFPISIMAFGSFNKKMNKSAFDVWMIILFIVVMTVFSISKTKIIHYSSMTYLPLSFLAAKYVYFLYENKLSINKAVKIGIAVLGTIWGVLLLVFPIIPLFKEKIIPYVDDKFAVGNLNVDVNWIGYEGIFGLLLLIGLCLALKRIKKLEYLKAIKILSLSVCISLFGFMALVVPKIEQHSQRSAIEFYEGIQNKNAYVSTIGFKSYAHYFYARVPRYSENDKITNVRENYINSLPEDESLDIAKMNQHINAWLTDGDIDKKTYLVCKVNKKHHLLEKPDVKLLYEKGGFAFFERNPK